MTSAALIETDHEPAAASTHPQPCAHCGSSVPAGLYQQDDAHAFCCSGCRVAFQLIHASGLSAYYEMAAGGGSPVGNDAAPTFLEYDDRQFLASYARELADGGQQITLAVDGIHCVACIWLLEKLSEVLDGVQRVVVQWSAHTAQINWDPQRIKLSQIARAIRRLGYRPQPLMPHQNEAREIAENRAQLIRLGAAGAAAGNNMLIALAIYLGWFEGMDAAVTNLLRWASCLVGLVSLSWPGRVFFQSAWSALRLRIPHMDLPIALGLGVGGAHGLINTIRGAGELYFDSLSVLVFLLLVGRYIQYRQQRRAADSIAMLYRLTPRIARRIAGGKVEEVLADQLRPQDIVEIRAGDLVPADGELIAGRTSLDEGLLTGESRPRERGVGDPLAAGTTNLSAAVRMRVTASGEATRVGQLMRLVEASADGRPQVVQWANRIGGHFVVVVIALAAVTLGWWWSAGYELAIDRASALLVVACPCALAMATPLAIAVALGRAAQRGILIKGGDVLQRLASAGTIWLDKTGTLTQGRMRVVEWRGDADALSWAAALERHSSHPIARAIVAFADEPGAARITADDVEQSTAGGIRGQCCGRRIAVGNLPFALRSSDSASPQLTSNGLNASDESLQMAQRGLTPVFVVVDGEIRGIFGLGDPLRSEAQAAVETLRRRGWRIGILSGDHPQIVAGVAGQLGIPMELARGGLTPEEKLAAVRSGDDGETVVMVGDGVNDSAALAAASVGIAVQGGSEVSLQAAPVYLNQCGLNGLAELMDGSRLTMRAIRNNLALSLAYNALGVTLAISGVINPLIAAVLMPISSLSVVGFSLAGNGFADRLDRRVTSHG